MINGFDFDFNFLIMIKFGISCILLTCFTSFIFSQKRFECGGYVSNLSLTATPQGLNDVEWADFLNTRVNTTTYFSDSFLLTVQLRNQVIAGSNTNSIVNIGSDRGLIDLTTGYSAKKNLLWQLQADRLFTEFTSGSWVITLGRQRINWSRTMVWNPNDIFNTYSYFDFDYVEKPGSDALRIQKYYGASSSVEGVLQADSTRKINGGLLWRTSYLHTDVQLLTAILNFTELCAGAGWEGSIGNVATRGELTYYHQFNDSVNRANVVLASVGFDYLFNENLALQFEFLYNDKKTVINNMLELYQVPLSAKQLSLSEYNFYLGATYQINPISSLSVSGMYFTDQSGFFMMPSYQISLTENVSLNILFQHFNLNQFNQRFKLNYLYCNVRWNF